LIAIENEVDVKSEVLTDPEAVLTSSPDDMKELERHE